MLTCNKILLPEIHMNLGWRYSQSPINNQRASYLTIFILSRSVRCLLFTHMTINTLLLIYSFSLMASHKIPTALISLGFASVIKIIASAS